MNAELFVVPNISKHLKCYICISPSNMNTCTHDTKIAYTCVYIMGQIYSISDIYRAKLVHAHLSVTVIAVALSGTNMYLAVCTLKVILL